MEAQTLRLSEAEFRRPFAEFWSDYFRNNPEVASVRCIPPSAWKGPRNGRPYSLRNVNIDTPIKQHVSESCRCLLLDVSQSVGPPNRFLPLQALLHGEKAGFYDCVLVEQPVSCLLWLMMHPPLLPAAQP